MNAGGGKTSSEIDNLDRATRLVLARSEVVILEPTLDVNLYYRSEFHFYSI